MSIVNDIQTKVDEIHLAIIGRELDNRLTRIESALFSGSGSGIVITSASIANVLKSSNYESGVAGWMINKTGNIEANDITVRGTVYATSGEFTGTIYAQAGEFQGTVTVGAGGAVQSSDYVADTSGWQLSSTGLEANSATIRGIIYASGGAFTDDVYVGEGSDRLLLRGSDKTIQTEDFISGSSGWQLAYGKAEFNNVAVRGVLKSAVFEYNSVSATSGTLMIAKSAGTLKTAATHTFGNLYKTINIDGHMRLFNTSDYLRIRSGTEDYWLGVVSYTWHPEDDGYYSYYCVVVSPPSGSMTFPAGSAVVNYGQSGQGVLTLTADASYSPYLDIATHTGTPHSGLTSKVRLGNLSGITDTDLNPIGYGLYSDNVYLKGSLVAGGGEVSINEDGIQFDTGTATANTLKWITPSGYKVVEFYAEDSAPAAEGMYPSVVLSAITQSTGVETGWSNLILAARGNSSLYSAGTYLQLTQREDNNTGCWAGLYVDGMTMFTAYKATQPRVHFTVPLQLSESTTPATPDANTRYVYAKSNGIYQKDSSGTEEQIHTGSVADALYVALTGNQTVAGVKTFQDGIDLYNTKAAIDTHGGFNNSGTWTRNQTPYGYIDLGPANTSYAHIYTDRPAFYFNRDLKVNGDTIWHAGNLDPSSLGITGFTARVSTNTNWTKGATQYIPGFDTQLWNTTGQSFSTVCPNNRSEFVAWADGWYIMYLAFIGHNNDNSTGYFDFSIQVKGTTQMYADWNGPEFYLGSYATEYFYIHSHPFYISSGDVADIKFYCWENGYVDSSWKDRFTALRLGG